MVAVLYAGQQTATTTNSGFLHAYISILVSLWIYIPISNVIQFWSRIGCTYKIVEKRSHMLKPAAQKSGYFSKKTKWLTEVLGSGCNYLGLGSVILLTHTE